MIGNNDTAKAYDNLQHSIDWCDASLDSQINVMEVMLQLLSQAKSSEIIFDYGSIDLRTGEKIYRSASEVWDMVNRRLFSTVRRKNNS